MLGLNHVSKRDPRSSEDTVVTIHKIDRSFDCLRHFHDENDGKCEHFNGKNNAVQPEDIYYCYKLPLDLSLWFSVHLHTESKDSRIDID